MPTAEVDSLNSYLQATHPHKRQTIAKRLRYTIKYHPSHYSIIRDDEGLWKYDPRNETISIYQTNKIVHDDNKLEIKNLDVRNDH